MIYCELTEAERDFYEALFKKSKVIYQASIHSEILIQRSSCLVCLTSETYLQVKFDKFVAEGRVLHNYASILELLLRLRQCCDHPFLVMRFGSCMDSFLSSFLAP